MAKVENLPPVPVNINAHSASLLPEAHLPPETFEKGFSPSRFDVLFRADTRETQALEGEKFILANPVHALGIIPPDLPPDMVDAVIVNCRTGKYKPDPYRHILIATSEAAEKIKSRLSDLPILSSEQFNGLVKEEVYEKYGATPPQEISTGFLNLGALIVDRLVLRRIRGQTPKYNHQYTVGIGTDKIGASPIKLAVAIARNSETVYVQKNKGARFFSIGTSVENSTNDLAREVAKLDLEPSSNIIITPELLDHVPLLTGNGQELITLITAFEYAGVSGKPIGKVLDEMDLRIDVAQLIREKEGDYETLLQIVGEEVRAHGEYLFNITPERLKELNERLKQHPRLGQLLPSVYNLLRDEMIDLDRVTAIEKHLHATHWQGVHRIVTDFIPSNMQIPSDLDDPVTLVTALDDAQVTYGIQPKVDSSTIAVQTTSYQGYDVKSGERHREAQFHDGQDQRKSLDRQLQGLFYFNRKNIYLEDESAKEALVEPGREFLAGGNVVWILPGFVERYSISDSARYHERLIQRPGRVIVVSPDEGTRDAASVFCNVVLDQNEVLQHINWDALIEAGILPHDRRVPISGKGVTILAGFLWAMAHELITDQTYVGHTDTDIANIDKWSIFYRINPGSKIPPYRAAEYMAAAAAKMPPSVQLAAIQPAKVGIERKSPVKHPIWMAMENFQQDAALRHAGYQLGRVTWASPGEGLVIAGTYRDHPWEATTGFDLDRYLKALVMELKRNNSSPETDSRFRFAQVVVPPPKIEMGGVSESTDFQEVNWATFMYTIAYEFYLKWYFLTQAGVAGALSPALPPDYSIAHLGEVNREYAGKQLRVIAESSPENRRVILEDPPMLGTELGEGVIYYPRAELFGKKAHQPNTTGYRFAPWRLPSITWMDQQGIIDWEGIRNTPNYSIVGQKVTKTGRWQ